MTKAAAEAALARVHGTLSYDDFRSVDMVIEAVVENVKLKQQIFSDLAAACKPDAILATNTSTIDIELVGGKVRDLCHTKSNHIISNSMLCI